MGSDSHEQPDATKLSITLPGELKSQIERAAHLAGSDLTTFIVTAAGDAALTAIQAPSHTFLDPADAAALLASLERPPRPSARLRAAIERYERTVDSKGIRDPAVPMRRWRNLFASAELRARLAPATIKAFTRLAIYWSLTDAEASTLFGMKGSSWKRIKAGLWKGVLSQDQMTRASLLIGIHGDLRIVLPDAAAQRWPRSPNDHRVFGGLPAIDAMIGGGIPQMLEARRYVAALAAGN